MSQAPKQYRHHEIGYRYERTPHQEAMVEACQTGQLAGLQALFEEHGIKSGDDPLGFGDTHRTIAPEGAPRTADLFAAAICHGHQSIVQYLHTVYPKYDFYSYTIVRALLDNPDLDMLRLIYSYAPDIVDLDCIGYDCMEESPVGIACEGGPSNAPFINFLLDHGAKDGGCYGRTARFGGALQSAVQYRQSLEIIEKMIPLTNYLDYPIMTALGQKRADVLKLLLQVDLARQSCPSLESAQRLLDDAPATQDKQIMELVESYAHGVKERIDRAERAKNGGPHRTEMLNVRNLMTGGTTRLKWWWQSRQRTELNSKTSDGTANSSRTPTDGTKTWWLFSSAGKHSKPGAMQRHEKELNDSGSDEENCKPPQNV